MNDLQRKDSSMKEQWNESTATAKGLYDPSFEHDNCGIGAVLSFHCSFIELSFRCKSFMSCFFLTDSHFTPITASCKSFFPFFCLIVCLLLVLYNIVRQ